jgi:hypothetical protein
VRIFTLFRVTDVWALGVSTSFSHKYNFTAFVVQMLLYEILLPSNPTPVLNHPSTETTHSPTFSAEVKNAWSNASISSYVFCKWSVGTDFRIITDWKSSNIISVFTLCTLFVALF